MASFACFAPSRLTLPSLAAEPVTFGGLPVEGKSVAFVCDGSRWTQNKLKELLDELWRSVNSMPADRQFAVIFFADGNAAAVDDGKLLPATDDNKQRLRNWLNAFKLGHDSTPIAGLAKAFEAKPETIVFLSDGGFEGYDEVGEKVAALNPDRAVRIDAVGFFASDDEDDSRPFVTFMKSLAGRNRGAFKAVYADELKRER